jgi:uncharacterized protein
MNNLLQPLSNEELTQLDNFLQECAESDDDNDEHDHEGDPGVINLSELNGMLTALVSGPTLVKTADWVPAIWGDEEPEWRDEAEFDMIVQLMQRHMNTIAATLLEAIEEYEPLFLYEEEDDAVFTIVDDWCEGYVRGYKLAAQEWSKGKPAFDKQELNNLLAPIHAFSSETNWSGHDLPDAEIDTLSDAITPNARAIYQFWHRQ